MLVCFLLGRVGVRRKVLAALDAEDAVHRDILWLEVRLDGRTCPCPRACPPACPCRHPCASRCIGMRVVIGKRKANAKTMRSAWDWLGQSRCKTYALGLAWVCLAWFGQRPCKAKADPNLSQRKAKAKQMQNQCKANALGSAWHIQSQCKANAKPMQSQCAWLGFARSKPVQSQFGGLGLARLGQSQCKANALGLVWFSSVNNDNNINCNSNNDNSNNTD